MTFTLRLLFLTFILSVGLIPSSFAAMQTSAKQAVIIDMGTGMVLLNKNASERMPTSSMSKVMTAYMVFDALKNGQIKMDTTLTVSEKAWRKGGSKMFIEVGEQVTVEDLLKGLIVQSGNDAAIALAEGIAGDEETFAMLMTQKAKELGMDASNFTNASGWPDPDHYSTAKDLAQLGQRLVVDFPHEYALYGLKEFTYNNIRQPNRNPLLYRDMGVDGIKTGHTEAGGYGLMASGEKDGRRVMMVVNGLESARDRANESARLMSWALNAFETITLIEKGTIIENVPVRLGKAETVALTIDRDLTITLPKGQKDDVSLSTQYQSPVPAPIMQGNKVGVLTVTIPQVGDFTVDLVAAEAIEEAGFVKQSYEKIKSMFFGGE
jgi:D-alanyl-D-alanine carboxypeptidase (penicillin-binding protein 5/6)